MSNFWKELYQLYYIVLQKPIYNLEEILKENNFSFMKHSSAVNFLAFILFIPGVVLGVEPRVFTCVQATVPRSAINF